MFLMPVIRIIVVIMIKFIDLKLIGAKLKYYLLMTLEIGIKVIDISSIVFIYEFKISKMF